MRRIAWRGALAEQWREIGQFLIIGGGPSYANALFSAAKLVEACGVNAIAQELRNGPTSNFPEIAEPSLRCSSPRRGGASIVCSNWQGSFRG